MFCNLFKRLKSNSQKCAYPLSLLFEKATLSKTQFRSSEAENKVWVNWDDLQGNDSTRATGATLTCSQQRRWLDSVKSVFRENRRHLGLSQVLRRGRGLLLRLPSSRLAVNCGHSRIIIIYYYHYLLLFIIIIIIYYYGSRARDWL